MPCQYLTPFHGFSTVISLIFVSLTLSYLMRPCSTVHSWQYHGLVSLRKDVLCCEHHSCTRCGDAGAVRIGSAVTEASCLSHPPSLLWRTWRCCSSSGIARSHHLELATVSDGDTHTGSPCCRAGRRRGVPGVPARARLLCLRHPLLRAHGEQAARTPVLGRQVVREIGRAVKLWLAFLTASPQPAVCHLEHPLIAPRPRT